MGRKRRLLGLVAAAIFVTGCAGVAEKVELRLRLQKGQSFGSRMQASFECLGASEDAFMTQTAKVDCTYEVLDVDEAGAATVKCTYRSLAHRLRWGRADSEPAELPSNDWWDWVSDGLPAEGPIIVLAPDGTITQVKGLDRALVSLFGQWESFSYFEALIEASFAEAFSRYFGDLALGGGLAGLPVLYPEQPVAIGDSWTRRVFCPGIAPTVLESTWTLMGRRDGKASIHLQATIRPEPEAAPLKFGLLQLRVVLSGQLRGTLEANEVTGWVTRAELRPDFSVTVGMADAREPDGRGAIPIHIRGAVLIEELQEPKGTPPG